MKIYIKYFHLFLVVILISACAGRELNTGYMPVLKDNVIPKVYEQNPSYCGYSGRAVLRFTDPMNNINVSVNINKKCNGDADIFFLGAFGVVSAHVTIRDGEYDFVSGSQSAQESLKTHFAREIILTVMDYLKTPPVYLDSSYIMFINNGNYEFYKDEMKVQVSRAFIIDEIKMPYYKVTYLWNKKHLKEIAFITEHSQLQIVFSSGKWDSHDI